MRKIKKIMAIFLLLFVIGSLLNHSNAVLLSSLDIQTDKTQVKPGEEIKININFGTELRKYTFKVAYDDALLEFVSTDGGDYNDTGDKIIVTSNNDDYKPGLNVIFKAKEGITTSNPTEFMITAEELYVVYPGMQYDDVTTPIVKNFTIEPEYVDYDFNIEYTGEIVANEEKSMKLSYFSTLGRYYEHARLIAEATMPEGATFELIGQDENSLRHNIVQSGWGDAQGFALGGSNVNQVLNVGAFFSKLGEYSLTLKLIDRDDSDSVFAEKTFSFTVNESAPVSVLSDENVSTQTVDTTPVQAVTTITTAPTAQATEATTTQTQVATEQAKTLIKTGSDNQIQIIVISIIFLTSVYLLLDKGRKE